MEQISKPSILVGPTSKIYPNLVDKAFENVAESDASTSVALIFEENGIVLKYTYSELDDFSNRLARAIYNITQEKGATQNSDGDYVIAVSMRPTNYLIVILLAIWKAGMTVLPLDFSSKGRVQHIIEEAKPTLLIYEDDDIPFSQKITYKDLVCTCSKYPSNRLSNEECYQRQINESIATILYTSGSTGVPKGVRLSHANILNRLSWQFETFPYSDTEKVVIFKTALTFSDSIGEIWGPLLNGLAMLVAPHGTTINPEKFICMLEKYKIERLMLVPSLLETMLMYLEDSTCKERLMLLKTWICSGEVLKKSLVKSFFKLFSNKEHRLCNFYGSTEVMADVTYYIISSTQQVEEYQNIPIGVPIYNTILYLLGVDLSPIEECEIGEIYVSGLNISKGYVGGKHIQKFLKNPFTNDLGYENLYRTGDFAKLDNGILVYEGRTDTQVKVRGYRVDLSEVERTLISIKGVLQGVVLCHNSGQLTQEILAFVTVENNITEKDIEKILKDSLTNYMMPHVIVIDSIPLLPSGKIDRQVLLKKYEDFNTILDGSMISYDGIPEPQLENAKVLFETILLVINKPSKNKISITSNFYEIGGNSLSTILTITSLKRKGYDIGIESFIGAENIGELLSIIGDNNGFNNKNVSSIISSYTTELLREEHKSDVIAIIVAAFSQKGNLIPFVGDRSTTEADFDMLMKYTWNSLLQENLSFVVKTKQGNIVGVSLSTIVANRVGVVLPYQSINAIVEILESVEKPILDNFLIANNGRAVHNLFMAVDLNLNTKENVSLVKYMEEQLIKLAKRNHFDGIFSSNSNPFTQQLATNVFSYKTLLDYQVNTYVAKDGRKPFGLAPDSLRLVVQWKEINRDEA